MPTITKKDLVVQIANETGTSKQEVLSVVHALISKITTDLADGNTVVVRNFGTFEPRVTKPKRGRNPRKPEQEVEIPAKAVVKFKPGKILKQKVEMALPKLTP